MPESGAIVSVKESYGLFINGEFTPSADGHAFKTISPASDEVLAEVPRRARPTAVVTGNTVVVLATSDVPGGVINVLTGRTAEVAPWLASHMDVNAIDLTGAPAALSEELAVAAAENLKRVLRGVAKDGRDEDWTQSPASTVCRPTSKPRPSGTLPAPDPSPHSTWWTSGLTSCRLGCVSDLSRQGACSGVGW